MTMTTRIKPKPAQTKQKSNKRQQKNVAPMCQPTELSVEKQEILALVPIVPALLSIVGSAAILRFVWVHDKGPYERFLIGLSLSDILMTVSIASASFLTPVGTMVWSFGNDASCAAMGALFQLGAFGAALYNASLSIYYLLTIRGGARGAVLARRLEPWMHGLCICFPLGTAVTGVALDAFRFSSVTGLCWVSCPSGHQCNGILLKYTFAAPVPLGWIVISVSMFLIWRYVYTTVRQHDTNSEVRRIRRRSEQASSTPSSTVRDVAVQALLYVSSFTFVTFWPILASVLTAHSQLTDRFFDPNRLFPLMVICSLFFPASGFFNVIIFLRPRYLSYRRTHPNKPRLRSLSDIVHNTMSKRRCITEETIGKQRGTYFTTGKPSVAEAEERTDNQQKEEAPKASYGSSIIKQGTANIIRGQLQDQGLDSLEETIDGSTVQIPRCA